MDTWTALLLCHPTTKKGGEKPPSITSSPDWSPQFNFSGAVAERHLENLKIIRSVGMTKFTEACHELSPEEILLRQKVYTLFCGPGKLVGIA
jgi:hypothetical protein